MDALVPAFVATLLVGVGDRPVALAAALGARGRFVPVASGLLIGHGIAIAMSVAGAFLIAPLLSPNAKALLLAIALLLAGFGALWRRQAHIPMGRSAIFEATVGAFVAGDSTAFLAFAFATWGSAPALAGVGALVGAMTVALAAASMTDGWKRLPLRALARGAGALLIATGLVVGLGALRLI